jgi:hypothetical protein
MSAFGGKADIIEKRVNVRLMTQAEDDPNGQARSIKRWSNWRPVELQEAPHFRPHMEIQSPMEPG